VAVGVHHGERGTIVHLLASGVTLEGDWEYTRGIRPRPVLWIRDSNGRWHTTGMEGMSPWRDPYVVALWLWIVPPLERGTAWIELSAAGRSAEVRVMLPLNSQYPQAYFDDGVRSSWSAGAVAARKAGGSPPPCRMRDAPLT